MKIVFVLLGPNIQHYIQETITNLLYFGHASEDIAVIVDSYSQNWAVHALRQPMGRDGPSGHDIQFVHAAELEPFLQLPPSYSSPSNRERGANPSNRTFRDGFWLWTSLRFFFLEAYMRIYNVTDVFHLENDNMCYADLSHLLASIKEGSPRPDKVHITFDAPGRAIGGFLFVPSAMALARVLAQFRPEKNDMENLGRLLPGSDVEPLPIISPVAAATTATTASENPAAHEYLWRNFDKLGGVIFDAAAIGQFLGGVDPRNSPGNTRGFVNETCVIKYNVPEFRFSWQVCAFPCDSPQPSPETPPVHLYRPVLEIRAATPDAESIRIPIVNLHIHSKALYQFRGWAPMPF